MFIKKNISFIFQNTHVKMAQAKHKAKVLEVYRDTAMILETFLIESSTPQKRRVRQISVPASAGHVLNKTHTSESEQNDIHRSKSMPLKPRVSQDEVLQQKEQDTRLKLGHQRTSSSADTEGDSSLVSENRQKKGFLRKVKERFLHSIHRQNRETELKRKKTNKSSPKTDIQGKKGSPKKEKRDKNSDFEKKQSHLFSETAEVDNKNRNNLSATVGDRGHTDGAQPDSRDNTRKSKGNLFNQVRRSFRKNKDKIHQPAGKVVYCIVIDCF